MCQPGLTVIEGCRGGFCQAQAECGASLLRVDPHPPCERRGLSSHSQHQPHLPNRCYRPGTCTEHIALAHSYCHTWQQLVLTEQHAAHVLEHTLNISRTSSRCHPEAERPGRCELLYGQCQRHACASQRPSFPPVSAALRLAPSTKREVLGSCSRLSLSPSFAVAFFFIFGSPRTLCPTRISFAGDLATVFMLEDRVTARTDSGQDCLDGSPNCLPWSPEALSEVRLKPAV